MSAVKQIRVKRWTVRVTDTRPGGYCNYSVYAVDQWDARLIAYAMTRHFPTYEMTAGQVDDAMDNTEIMDST